MAKRAVWSLPLSGNFNWVRILCFHSRGQHLCKFIGRKESVYIRKEFKSHRTGLGHQHGRHFIVLGHKYGRHDVMWKHTIFEKTYVISNYRLSYYFSYSENVCKTAKKLFGKKSCFKRHCISKFGQFDEYQMLTFFFSGWPNTLWANKRMHQ